VSAGVGLVLALVLWGTLAGLDLASLFQTLLSRPLVVGAATGWLLGEPAAGLRLGALLELFALDVVPVGSSRYPDFGAATVGATIVAAAGPWEVTLGAAGLVGIALAIVGGSTLPTTRRLNARAVRAYTPRLEAGDPAAVRAVQLVCLGHDVVRSGVLALVAVGVGAAVRYLGWLPGPGLGDLLTDVALGGAGWAVAHGAVASARSGARWRWAVAGLAVGALGAASL